MGAGPGGAGAGAEAGAAGDVRTPAGDARGGANAQGDMKSDKSGSSAQGEADTKGGKSAAGEKSDTKAGKSAEGGKEGSTKEGRAAASADVSSEQKTKIRDRFKSEKVDRVNIDFNLSVGTAIPTHVHTHVHTVPVWLVEIVPAYRGYSYIVLADGRIVIIEPASYEVVTIISV